MIQNLGGAGTVRTAVKAVAGETVHLVVKSEFREGMDRFTLFVNPPAGSEEPANGASKEDLDLPEVIGLGFSNSGAFSADELRVSPNYADMFVDLPQAPMPDPDRETESISITADGQIETTDLFDGGAAVYVQSRGGESVWAVNSTIVLSELTFPLEFELNPFVLASSEASNGIKASNFEVSQDLNGSYTVVFDVSGTMANAFAPSRWELAFQAVIEDPTDSDADGLTGTEEQRYGTDPNNPDTDSDGLNDGSEVKEHGTSPLIVDTDGDGSGDGDEVDHGRIPMTLRVCPLIAWVRSISAMIARRAQVR